MHDALDFLLQNFTEMNKLWVRMQHQASPLSTSSRSENELACNEITMVLGLPMLLPTQEQLIAEISHAEPRCFTQGGSTTNSMEPSRARRETGTDEKRSGSSWQTWSAKT